MPDVAGHFEGIASDGGGLLQPSTTRVEKTDEDIILEIFLQNMGRVINTGLVIAGQNNGQPQSVMDSLWSGQWASAKNFIDSFLAEADRTSVSFARAQTNSSQGVPLKGIPGSFAPAPASATTQPTSFLPGGLGAFYGAPPAPSGTAQRGQLGLERAGAGIEDFSLRTSITKLDPKLQNGRDYYLKTIEGIREAEELVWEWYRGRVSFDIGNLRLDQPPTGGGGRRGFTAAEIRNRFDLDELTRQATNLFRTTLLTDDVDTRPMAKAYIEAVVATKGEKEINFVEFITKKIEDTDRYASIYRSKPGSMTTAQYLLPYFQAAQVAGPGDASGVAIEGAQFGSDPATFNARLRRTDAVTSSSAFINELQSKFSELNKVFKG